MAYTEWYNDYPYIVPRNGVPEVTHAYREYDSETFKAGCPVYVANAIASSTGEVKVAADASFSGIALKSATNVTSSNIVIPIMIGRIGDLLFSKVYNNSDTAVLSSTLTPGTKYDIYMSSTSPGYCGVDASDTTGGFLEFVEPCYDSTGTELYWGKFRITAATTGFIG